MPEWSKDSLHSALENKGWLPTCSDIQNGVRFKLERGTTINLYHTGRTVVGGPVTSFKSEVEAFINAGPQENGTVGDARTDQTGSAAVAGEVRPLASEYPALHVDIQVHIDSSASAEQIEQIFASMARHLYGREPQ